MFRKNIIYSINKNKYIFSGIQQFYVNVEREDHKFMTLVDLYETLTITQCVIFINTRRKVEWLTSNLTDNGHTVSQLVGFS